MARNTSRGVVQIAALSLFEVNRALQELSARLDALEGLRGPVTIADALLVDKRVEAHVVDAPSPTMPLHGFGASEEDG